jgi:hypothetical protein
MLGIPIKKPEAAFFLCSAVLPLNSEIVMSGIHHPFVAENCADNTSFD